MIWEEKVELGDGTPIYIRVVQPTDRHCFEEGWLHLSATSRRYRFLGPRDGLSEEELAYLTEVDGVDHYAIGAVTRNENGEEGAVAVARFIRLEDRGHCADFAITVVDAFQRQGIGTLLFRKLIEAAVRRGIYHFRADLLRENRVAKHLIQSVAPRCRFHTLGAVLRFNIPLTDDEDDADGAPHAPCDPSAERS